MIRVRAAWSCLVRSPGGADDPPGDLMRCRRAGGRGHGVGAGTPRLQQPTHGPFAAAVAALAQLLGEPHGVGAALLPACGQVGGVSVEVAAPARHGGDQFLGGGGAGVAPHRLGVQIQRSADRGGPDPLVRQGADLSPALSGQLGAAPEDNIGRFAVRRGGLGRIGLGDGG